MNVMTVIQPDAAEEPISIPQVVTRENIGKMIAYLLRQDDSAQSNN
jgi:hypothetical protein